MRGNLRIKLVAAALAAAGAIGAFGGSSPSSLAGIRGSRTAPGVILQTGGTRSAVDTATTTPSGLATAPPSGGQVRLIPPEVFTRQADAASAPDPTCHDSGDPACGPFRWEPQPQANAPLTVELTEAPTRAAVNQQVTFLVTYTDPDAPSLSTSQNFGDTPVTHMDYIDDCGLFGPWTPPAPQAGSEKLTLTHTFRQPGTYHVVFSASSFNPAANPGCVDTTTGVEGDPYASSGEAALDIVVSNSTTQRTDNTATFSYQHPGDRMEWSSESFGPDDNKALAFTLYGNNEDGTPAHARLYGSVTNRSNQMVMFAGGLDVLAYLQHDNAPPQQVHLHVPNLTSLEPGATADVAGSAPLDGYGGYGLYGTVTFGFAVTPTNP